MISSAFAAHVHKALSPSQSQPFLRQVFYPCILVYSEATLGRLQRPWFDAGAFAGGGLFSAIISSSIFCLVVTNETNETNE